MSFNPTIFIIASCHMRKKWYWPPHQLQPPSPSLSPPPKPNLFNMEWPSLGFRGFPCSHLFIKFWFHYEIVVKYYWFPLQNILVWTRCLMHRCVCIWWYILQNYNYKLHFQNLFIYDIPDITNTTGFHYKIYYDKIEPMCPLKDMLAMPFNTLKPILNDKISSVCVQYIWFGDSSKRVWSMWKKICFFSREYLSTFFYDPQYEPTH